MPPDEPLIRFDWIADNLDVIGRRLGEHLVMTVIAVLGGFFISFALALLIRRHRRVHGPVLAVSGVLYTIPSLALFALLIPFTGLSLLSAEVALVSYTVLILVRNVHKAELVLARNVDLLHTRHSEAGCQTHGARILGLSDAEDARDPHCHEGLFE